MQTFLPFPDFKKSAKTLDRNRLGKQRLEAYQILMTISLGRKGWSNHPAVKMWRGFEEALAAYMDVMIEEWVTRGYKNTMPRSDNKIYRIPPWLGEDRLHLSHQSNLIRKMPEFYKPQFPEVPDNIPYFWPIK